MSEQVEDQVTNPESDVAEAMVTTEGATSAGAEAVSSQGAVDVDFNARLTQVEQKYEKDIRALKSSLQRSASEKEKTYQTSMS